MASSSAACFNHLRCNVFLSFRGEDTRDSFISRLSSLLCRNKIRLFVNEELHGEDEISPALLSAIEESAISVIIFSEQYAFSKCCLDELVKILECKKKNDQIVLPVFYRVNPSDVRRQTGSFGDAFVKQANSFKVMPEKVQQWRFALKEASNDPVKIRPEGKLADGIVNDILMKLEKKFAVQKENVTTSATESKLAVEENPVPSPKHLAEDEMTLPPSRHTLAMHKSEIQLATLDTEESAADVSRKMATNVAAKENPEPNPKHLAEDEMIHSPSRHMQAMPKSEIQPGTLGTEGSAAYVSGKMATNVAAEENPVPSPKHLAEDEMIHSPSRHTQAMPKSEIQPGTLGTEGSAAYVSGKMATNVAAEENPVPSPKHLAEDEMIHSPSRHTQAMPKSEIQPGTLGTEGSAAYVSGKMATNVAAEENPVPSPKHLAEDEMTHSPSRHTQAMPKSEIQPGTLGTEGSAAYVSGKMATNVAAEENPVPSPKHLAEDEMTHSPSRHTQAMPKSEIQPGTLGTEGSAAYVSGKMATNVAAEENPVPSPKHLAEDEMIHSPSRHTQAMPKSEIQPGTLGTEGSAAYVSGKMATNVAAEENPVPSPKHLAEDEMTHSPSRHTQAMHKSEIQPGTLETEGSAAHMSADGSPLYIHAKFGAWSFQDKGKEQTIHGPNACGKPSANPAVPVAGAELGTGNMIAVKSLKRNVQKIFRCVNDVRVSKIGVHGVGGIGKTTVLKALISYSKTKNMFPWIMLVTVSRYWNIRKIQIEVLRQFLSCRENHKADSLVAESVVHGTYESDSQVAEKLLQVLKGKNFFLLLDDVWEQIDLVAVGIPDPSSNNGCKILMASRKLDVCQNMNVSKVIELESLSGKEAWELFGKQVGRIIDLPDIRPFARAVVKGCHGLPLLIIVTGKALKGERNVSVWEHASQNFSLSSTTGAHHTSDVIQLLKFSFDCLKDHDIKSCFLYCALFPEDEGVNISDLVEYFIQEGLITTTWADAHERGHDIVYVLVHISLLQVTEGGDSIKMHGLIRDLALGILSSAVENNQFMLRAEGRQFLCKAYLRLTAQSNAESSSSAILLTRPESSRLFIPAAHQFLLGASAGLTELPIEEWKQAEMIFLMDNKLCTLPEKPSCPNLLTLFLQRNHQLREIPPSFFESMTSLKVLNLSNTRIKSLPNTIVSLKNLEILILRDCEHLVVLPSEVGSLVLLEVLDLRGTEINHLPDEIGELASLRYLEVFFYGSVNKSEYVKLPHNLISRGTILRLEALETLSIVVSSGDERWYKDAKSVMIEVSKLPKLSTLRFHFPEVELVDLFLKESVAWKGQMLTKFKFVVGHHVKSITSRVPDYVEFDYNQQSRCLRFVNCPSISPGVCQILARSTAFYVDHHIGIDNLSNFGIDNINALKYCIISECPGIKTLVDDIKEHGTPIFPSLESLNFYLLWNFTSIWNENLPGGSFAELRILSVHACPKLKYVFTSSMIGSLSKLEKLAVEDCEIIETIIAKGEMTDSGCIMLSSLKMLRLNYLPRLENVGRIVCPSLEYISFYDCPQLKKIDLDSKLKALIEIKAEKNWWDALEWEDSEEHRELRKHLEHHLTIN